MGKVLLGNTTATFDAAPSDSWFLILNTAFFRTWLNNATEANREYKHQIAGAVTGLSARVSANTLSTAATTVRLRVNGANVNNTLSIAAGVTGWITDGTSSDAIAANDLVDVNVTVAAGGTGTATFKVISGNFAATSGHSMVYAGGVNNVGFSTASNTFYLPFAGLVGDQGVEGPTQFTARAAGTLKDLTIYIPSNARGTTTTFRSRKNTANGNQVLSVTASSTGFFQDTSNTDTIASGDVFNGSGTTGTGAGAMDWSCFGVTLTSSGTNNDIFCQGAVARTASATVHYQPISGWFTTFGTMESDMKIQHGFAGTASNLRVHISANTYTGAATLKLRKNAADGNQSVSITAGTTGVFEDASNSDSFASTDDIDLSVSGGTANSATFDWFSLLEAPANDLSISVTEDITITESVTMLVDENINLNDSVTVSEAVTMMMDLNVVVSDDVAVSESFTVNPFFSTDLSLFDDITVSESVTLIVDPLVPSIFDSVTISESMTLDISAQRTGLMHMRSTEQSYPLMMDENEVN